MVFPFEFWCIFAMPLNQHAKNYFSFISIAENILIVLLSAIILNGRIQLLLWKGVKSGEK